jgi:hypothetical protein
MGTRDAASNSASSSVSAGGAAGTLTDCAGEVGETAGEKGECDEVSCEIELRTDCGLPC